MIKLIDNFLNTTTMYSLIWYILIFFLLIAEALSFFGVLPFTPASLLFSAVFLTGICWITNKIFATALKAPTNFESVYITALILSLIFSPANNFNDLIFLILVGVLAIASKYILAINKKHIFNPAAFSAVSMALIFHQGASWWVGNYYMLIPVLLGGLLIIKKVRCFSLVLTFLIIYAVLVGPQIVQTMLDSPIFFFAFIMLIEPQTTPPTKILQIFYGALVGVGTFYQTPEIALLLGNIFSYIVYPKEKLILTVKEKIQIAPDIFELVFNGKLKFLAGQYMEWTLGQKNPDNRGSRRYFTIASSPTEDTLRIGVKFYQKGSSFKKSLLNMKEGDQIVASQLSGEFTLPKDPSKKLAFLAGGIGITPFRSMIKYLLDSNQKRDVVLFYSNKTAYDIVYKDIFDKASKLLGIKTFYVNTDIMGYIDEKMIKEKVSDFKQRIFYISGPHSMVDAFEKTLKEMGIKNIKVDFFPGYV